MAKSLISVIVPVYNEEDNVDRAYQSIVTELAKCDDVEYEILFTDNHSKDGTFDRLAALAATDARVRVLRYTRNFGFHRSILTGYRLAAGDAAIQLDCDLEDPPSILPEFIRLWRAGHDVVIGRRVKRHEARPMLLMRRLHAWLLNRISDLPHEVDTGDFRLVDRTILDQLRVIDDAHPYVRGLISELARHPAFVPYGRNKREKGESKFPLRQLLRFGLEGIYAHSTTPLRLATYFGILVAGIATVMSGGYATLYIASGRDWPPGFATLLILILFSLSMNALFLGIIGEYLARIYNQVRRRPTVVIEKTINVDSRSSRAVERV